jgi:hypothetical protein
MKVKADRFLLYIDILGFAEMTRKEPRKVARLYAIIDSLNVHRHQTFRTIVFSDTILVYNPDLAVSDEDRSYLVWYLIEFAEDLHHRLTGQDIYFRAVVTSGSFSHYRLQNIECFFGDALVSAYLHEKEIPSIGLFIDNDCNMYNKYFRVTPFDGECHFVYLNRSLETLNQYTGGIYPFTDRSLGFEDATPYVPWQVRFLKDVHENMQTHRSPTVRTKFLTAWNFYSRRYPQMTQALANNAFSLVALGPAGAWNSEANAMEKAIRSNKRMGSGTQLSLQVTADVKRRGRNH